MIVVGVMIACYGEIQFVLIGFIFQVLGVIAEATRLTLVQQLLTSKKLKMDPLCSLYFFAPICGAFNLLAFFAIEFRSVTLSHLQNVGILHFLANALCAFGLNVAVVFLVFTCITPRSERLLRWFSPCLAF